MNEKISYIYILASERNGTLYVGVTTDLKRRIWEHKKGDVDGFTKRYRTNNLVYYEVCNDMISAIEREKQIKAGSRKNKISLIEKENTEWSDLYDTL